MNYHIEVMGNQISILLVSVLVVSIFVSVSFYPSLLACQTLYDWYKVVVKSALEIKK